MDAHIIEYDKTIMGQMDRVLFDHFGRMRLFPASVYRKISPKNLRMWASFRAIYQFPTTELVCWLLKKIGRFKAIEIGAGNNDLGYYLNIPSTDNYCQVFNQAVAMYFAALRQTPTKPKGCVEHLDAMDAIIKYRPDIVIGSWITQKAYEEEDPGGGNMFGPVEEEILQRVRKYILIGNEKVHGKKRISKYPHTVYRFPWLISRASKPEFNCIYEWNGFC